MKDLKQLISDGDIRYVGHMISVILEASDYPRYYHDYQANPSTENWNQLEGFHRVISKLMDMNNYKDNHFQYDKLNVTYRKHITYAIDEYLDNATYTCVNNAIYPHGAHYRDVLKFVAESRYQIDYKSLKHLVIHRAKRNRNNLDNLQLIRPVPTNPFNGWENGAWYFHHIHQRALGHVISAVLDCSDYYLALINRDAEEVNRYYQLISKLVDDKYYPERRYFNIDELNGWETTIMSKAMALYVEYEAYNDNGFPTTNYQEHYSFIQLCEYMYLYVDCDNLDGLYQLILNRGEKC